MHRARPKRSPSRQQGEAALPLDGFAVERSNRPVTGSSLAFDSDSQYSPGLRDDPPIRPVGDDLKT
jgi:hypothetical protein